MLKKFIQSALLLVVLFTTVHSYAQVSQAPDGIQFQALATDANGRPAAGRVIYVRDAIIAKTATGSIVYSETFKVTASSAGIFTIVLGKGTYASGVTSIANIDWSNGPFFLNLKIAVEPTVPNAGWNVNNEYVDLGTSQFWSVPYALYAGNVRGADGKLNTSDTAAMLKPYFTAINLKANSADVNISLALKANTSDVNTALATKVDKVTGKELSTNDYTTAEKTKLAAISGTNTGDQDLSSLATTAALALKANTSDVTTALATKVDKVTGKDLSTNDYTTAEKTKLAAITGTNTGDQTTITGNAATATKLATPRNINGIAFDGTANITVTADAGTLAGTSLKSTITGSSLTTVGTLQNLTVTNPIVGSITGNATTATTAITASTVTTNANLTGPVTSIGNATTITDGAVTNAKITDVAATKITGTLPVSNGGTGAATAAAARTNLGLGNVDNTTDAAKPISTLTQAALDLKANTETANFTKDIIVNSVNIGRGNGENGSNTRIGSQALTSNTVGYSNVAIGDASLSKNTTGGRNNAIGYNALLNNTTGSENTAIGTFALENNINGNRNLAIGQQTLSTNTEGIKNVALGYVTLYSNTTGSNNNAIGDETLFYNTTGNYNTGMGSQAGLRISTGSQNTMIGAQADVASGAGALTNATAVGYGAIVTSSNTMQLGNASVTDVKTSGTLTAGNVTYPKTHGSANQVLSTTGSGILAWVTPSTIATSYNGILPLANGGTGQTSVSGIKSALGLLSNNVAIGNEAGTPNQGVNSNTIAIGGGAGRGNQGQSSVAIGYVSGDQNQGANSISIGGNSAQAGQGSQAVAIGYAAGQNSQGANAVAIGTFAGQSGQAANSIAINATGTNTPLNPQNSGLFVDPIRSTTATTNLLFYNTTSKEITAATGNGSFVDLTTSQTIAGTKIFSSDISVNGVKIGRGNGNNDQNVAVGADALASGTGTRNTAIGYGSMRQYSGTSFDNNTSVGYFNLPALTSGSGNTSIGAESMMALTTGTENTSIGNQSLINTTGNNNVGVGKRSGQTITTGSQNTILGTDADVSTATLTNATALGYGAVVTANNTVQLGSTSVTNVNTSGTITAAGLSVSGKVIVGASSAASASAVLEASSTTQGFLPPRMTTAQRDAIASPAVGLLIYNTTNNSIDVYTTITSSGESFLSGSESCATTMGNVYMNNQWDNLTRGMAQSFVSGGGLLSSITIKVGSVVSQSTSSLYELNVYNSSPSGCGNNGTTCPISALGTPIATSQVSINTAGEITLNLVSPVSLTLNQTYTFSITPTVLTQGFSWNCYSTGYSSGASFGISGNVSGQTDDFKFRTNYVSGGWKSLNFQ